MNKFYYVSRLTEEEKSKFVLPTRETKGSAGYDFHSPISFTLAPHETIKIALGVKCELDKNKVLFLAPRSSLGFKYFTVLCNTIGVIDSDYYNNVSNEGEISVKLHNFGDKKLIVHENDKIVQGIILSFYMSDDDTADGVRVGGVGSTGK